jgi:hypothetical protein
MMRNRDVEHQPNADAEHGHTLQQTEGAGQIVIDDLIGQRIPHSR